MKAGELRVDSNGLLGRSSSLVIASHELKSPLALLRQLAMELSDSSLSPEEQKLLVYQMKVISDKALRLTSNVTRSASLDQTSFPFEPINPVELCEDVIHELFPLYKALGKSIQIKRRSKAPLVVANRDLLRRILLNFGDNALHYTNEQPVVFNIAQVGEEVEVGLRDRGPIVAGGPVKSVNLAGRPESSGLGLEICGLFAEVMNGYINQVKHRDGMTYYVRLQPSTQMSLL